jgi:hypothetical protein
VREDAEFLAHVVDPDDVGVLLGDFHNFVFHGHVFRFVFKGAIVSVGHTFGVEADDFATVGDEPHAVSFDRRGGAKSDVFPITHLTGAEFGDDELPEEGTIFFIESHHDAAVAFLLFIAGRFVVSADVDFSVGDDGVAVGLGTELGGPLDVFGISEDGGLGFVIEFAGVDVDGKVFGFAGHVTVGGATPHRPILGGGVRDDSRDGES